eukprot:1162064-Pelagomonas_calceolata.AAC.5
MTDPNRAYLSCRQLRGPGELEPKSRQHRTDVLVTGKWSPCLSVCLSVSTLVCLPVWLSAIRGGVCHKF